MKQNGHIMLVIMCNSFDSSIYVDTRLRCVANVCDHTLFVHLCVYLLSIGS